MAIALAIPLTVLTAAGVFEIAGISPLSAFSEIASSSFGNWNSATSSIVNAIPIFLVAVGVSIALRAGLWNIGGDGQLYVGALAGTFLGHDFPRLGLPWDLVIGVLGCALGGALFALIPALLTAWMGANEVVTTLMLLYVGEYLVSYMVEGTGPLAVRGATVPSSVPVHTDWMFPAWGSTSLNWAIAVVPVVAIGAYFLMRKSTFGLQSRALGESPRAAVASGVPAKRVIVIAMCLSGALAGLAGGVMVLGEYGRLLVGFDPSYGFTGIAVALLGGLTLPGMAIGALLFGGLQAGGVGITVLGGSGAIVQITEGAATIYLVALLGAMELWRRKRIRPPSLMQEPNISALEADTRQPVAGIRS
ncbi:MAG: ABC transporter permease [Acidimicrobiales bacterium]